MFGPPRFIREPRAAPAESGIGPAGPVDIALPKEDKIAAEAAQACEVPQRGRLRSAASR